MRFSQTSPLRARRRFRRRPRPRRFACRMEELAIPQCASLCGGAKMPDELYRRATGVFFKSLHGTLNRAHGGPAHLPCRCVVGTKMPERNFTINFGPQHPAAHGVCCGSCWNSMARSLNGRIPYRPSSVRRRFSLPAIRRLRPEASQDTTERNPPSGSNLRLDRF